MVLTTYMVTSLTNSLCDECLSQSSTLKKNKKKKKNSEVSNLDEAEQPTNTTITPNEDNTDRVRCPLCVEEGVTVPAEQVEYTDNGVRGRTNSFSEGGDASSISTKTPASEANDKKAAKSVLKWGGGHATKKKEKRRFGRKLCQFGTECIRKDCFFYHPERENNDKK